MKKLLLLVLLVVGCGNSLLYWGKPVAEVNIKAITKSNCDDECKKYEYDENFMKLIDDYEHPWCICMTQCMRINMIPKYDDKTNSFTFIDSSYCSPTIINPIDTLKNKIRTQ